MGWLTRQIYEPSKKGGFHRRESGMANGAVPIVETWHCWVLPTLVGL